MKKGDIVSDGTHECKVQWRVEETVAVQSVEDKWYKVFEIGEDHGFKVIVSADPSYQSTVADMSDDDLRASIEALRTKRMRTVSKAPRKQRTSSKSEAIDKNDPMALALASMPEDKKRELMAKLGLI